MMPSQCCVDVDMEESVVQTLHSVQKPCNLQHSDTLSDDYLLVLEIDASMYVCTCVYMCLFYSFTQYSLKSFQIFQKKVMFHITC